MTAPTADQRALARLEALADRLTPDVARAWLRAVRQIRDAATLSAIERAITTGDVEAALEAVFGGPHAVAALNGVGDALRAVLSTGGAAWARDLPPVPSPRPGGAAIRFTFDVLHPAVSATLASYRAEVLRTMTESLREGFRAAIAAGIEAGVNPRETARQVRSLIGLGEHDVQLVASFRRQLETADRTALTRTLRDRRYDGPLRRAAEGGKALTREQIETSVAAYQRRLLAWRAETATRTATLDALRLAQDSVWDQAIADGRVTADRITTTWVTRLDGRERPQHHRMHRRTVRKGEPFRDPATGRVWRRVGEGDYNCRCAAVTRIWPSGELAARAIEDRNARPSPLG
ncbi:putative head morphogenesis protein SPP1 gp7 (plasmid) [Gemmatirosa kalamazoonensis]|uniref:Putative head morphogenesis protein SPP1 gp7 n=1 Tax=Gemmatirosa kalamazoonensis TaxID=861299 RepID=W0RM33_9BACT|nr:hypothetical protein [Gemmatirosa kalamazoonensis]AHG92134.1 putative head morphogenesis protein SPP1 gp7 [Gemmatirosa kalamazoonensis]AHG92202.1 putative head morphogenesis protein SPP1 gp7 [Gemmatirosa kalamazoonensis]